MTESQTPTRAIHPTRRKVSIQERAVLVGDIVFVNAYKANLSLLKKRFVEGGYQAQETPHFLLLTRMEAPSVILVHWFDRENIDADVKHYVAQELQPLGLLPTSQRYGEILAGIVGSGFPGDARRAWKYFGANTLQRFMIYLSTVSAPPFPDYTTIGSFATQYQRICELCSGKTFLDAGCESGFLPLLIAERMPFMERVVGLDIRPDMFDIAREIAEERQLHTVQFIQSDLLAEDFSALGQFDTVTAIGVIEHFVEESMYCVLANLLKVTKHRLILTVPYGEETPTPFYGHEQLFTRPHLETLGKWCLEQLGNCGKMWVEECVGGLLLIERDE
jgi:SAM-dependent methyltransferase